MGVSFPSALDPVSSCNCGRTYGFFGATGRSIVLSSMRPSVQSKLTVGLYPLPTSEQRMALSSPLWVGSGHDPHRHNRTPATTVGRYPATVSDGPTRRLSGQCILAPYNLGPLNPRPALPAPARRRETTPIRALRPIPTCPHAYWSKGRRAWVFDSLHHPTDAVPGAACPNGAR